MKRLMTLLLLVLSLPLYAGSSANQEAKFKPDEIKKFAKQVERYAASHGAHAFIIGRVGRDPKDLPKGIKYTHTAIAVYSQITLKDGNKAKGYVIHNLYQREGQSNKSDLVKDYPVDFFWGAEQLKAGITIPSAEVQKKLIAAINKGVPAKVHNPNYSVIANPFNNIYQNCTEHTLLVLNAAIYNTNNLPRLYANNKAYFKPQRVEVSPMKLMLGDIFVKDVSADDHHRKINTATFTTIAQYLNKYDLVKQSVTLDSQGRVTNNL